MDSILTSIKKLIGITKDDTSFDTDIIMFINYAFFVLHQLGVGPKKAFAISDASSTWDEFTNDAEELESVKTYVYLKVKTIFDPPANSALMQSITNTMNELEWRLVNQIETPGNS